MPWPPLADRQASEIAEAQLCVCKTGAGTDHESVRGRHGRVQLSFSTMCILSGTVYTPGFFFNLFCRMAESKSLQISILQIPESSAVHNFLTRPPYQRSGAFSSSEMPGPLERSSSWDRVEIPID